MVWLAYPLSVGPFRFPDDEGSHPEFREEWWYLQSHFKSEEGNRFGFINSYVNQGYRISALVDLDHRVHRRFIYTPDSGSLLKSESRHDVSQGRSWWRQRGKPFNYLLHEEITANGIEYGSLDLDLAPLKPPVSVGGGLVRMGRNGSTYWYALTRMKVTGTMSRSGKEEAVEGAAWIDRQWGSWNWMGFWGWKWFSVQLEDGRDIIAFQIHEPVSMRPIVRVCQIVLGDGSCVVYNGVEVTDHGDWRSPETGEQYSCGWTLGLGQPKMRMEIVPAFPEQEVYRGLWEGSCVVEGVLDNEKVSGIAFVELSTGRPATTPIRYLSYLKAIGLGLMHRARLVL